MNGSGPVNALSRPPLRVFASGTVFNTQRLSVPLYPEPGGVARAQNVQKTRGGHSVNVLVVLAQFYPSGSQNSANSGSNVIVVSATGGQANRGVGDVQFSGPLPGNDEGDLILKQLEGQNVGTLFSIIREGKGVPTAWIIEAADGTKTVINHNPLADMSHDEFVARLGPVLAPENYEMSPSTSQSQSPTGHGRRRSGSGPLSPQNVQLQSLSSPYSPYIYPGRPPFDWLHFEGRNPHVTHANMSGLEGLARERGWRNKCVFSLQIGRGGTEVLMHSADVIFFSKPYAMATHPGSTPREFLISMCTHAPHHALLIADWGAQGAALLSVPTREYLQSSGWVEPTVAKPTWDPSGSSSNSGLLNPGSVKSGSNYWADGRPVSDSNSSDWRDSSTGGESHLRRSRISDNGDTNSDSGRASIETERGMESFLDEVGAHEAFVAGMIFALSQRLLPGPPYTRDGTGQGAAARGSSGRWKLEECLRFATELAGRKGRRMSFSHLRTEMESGGWIFE